MSIDGLSSGRAQTGRPRGRSFTFAVPTVDAQTFNDQGVFEPAKQSTRGLNSQRPKAKHEFKKLLSHIINELENRPKASNSIDTRNPIPQKGGAQINVNDIITFRVKDPERDEDEEDTANFSTDAVLELMSQLKEALHMFHSNGWNISDDLHDSDLNGDSAEKSNSFRFRRSSSQPGTRRSRSLSNSAEHRAPASSLLDRCVSLLSSIILEDCRFQVSFPRPSRPPFSLQAVTLDVARILVILHRNKSTVLYEVGQAMLPAFSTFPKVMFSRLLHFFDEGILRIMLENLSRSQNRSLSSNDRNRQDADLSVSSDIQGQPIVAIQVDEVQDDGDHRQHSDLEKGWLHCSPPGVPPLASIVSSYAPSQSTEIYHLSSLASPLLAAVLDNVDIHSSDAHLAYRLSRLLMLIKNLKVDAALNVLEIIAYHSERARLSAANLLVTLWPNTAGHTAISRKFLAPPMIFDEKNCFRQTEYYHLHQFMPWRFDNMSSPAVFEGSSFHDCHSCFRQIEDFGLLCPSCFCAVHHTCYDTPDGSSLTHYPVVNESNKERVVVHRFSYVRPTGEKLSETTIVLQEHQFRLVNLFTLCLCTICHRPLWGITAQGYRCGSCNQYAHLTCLQDASLKTVPGCAEPPDSSYITVDWAVLRTSFADYYHDILYREEEVLRLSCEEVTVFWSILWLQLQLLKLGLASGSIIISQVRPTTTGGQSGGVDDFELQYLVRLYEAYILSGRLPTSDLVNEFYAQNGRSGRGRLLLFDWPALLFVTSVLRSPQKEEEAEFLVVDSPDVDRLPEDLASQPYELTSIAFMRDVIGRELNLRCDQAACLFLSHILQCGLFEAPSLRPGYFRSCSQPTVIECRFPLPSGLDLSSDVEILVAAVESCLRDLDLSVNEIGLLLLSRRLWPNAMMSEYASKRLARAVLKWILSEDDNLIIIARTYVARNQDLPGVPSTQAGYMWPYSLAFPSLSSSSSYNGADYVSCRKALVEKYARRWLYALHCLDYDFYSQSLFEILSQLAGDAIHREESVKVRTIDERHKDDGSRWAEQLLRNILKIYNCSLSFSAVDDLVLLWLNQISDTISMRQPLPTLPRLFNRDPDSSIRWTASLDMSISNADSLVSTTVDPWRVVLDVASKDVDGLAKATNWLCIFACSGVDIPITTFLQISALARDLKASFAENCLIGEAAFMATWLKSSGRQDLQKVISDLHDRCNTEILERIKKKEELYSTYRFVRLSFSTTLLLYGCERSKVQAMGLVTEDDVKALPSRRKIIRRASPIPNNPMVEIDFVELLAVYLNEGSEELRTITAKFLSALITEASQMTSQELESFILNNGYFLTRCAWKLYDTTTSPDTSDLRITILLQVLATDPQPFEEILTESFESSVDLDSRLDALTRLFKMILDVKNPAFHVDGRQWKSNVLPIFYKYFSCIWGDEREEIRHMADIWSRTLQPVHFQEITSCFNEALSRSPIADRLTLISFVLQTRAHFPSWKAFSWDTIIETLMDDDFMQRNGNAADALVSAHLSIYGLSSGVLEPTDGNGAEDPDMASLQCSLVLLSLQMIADGIGIDLFSFLKIKFHLVVLLGFSNPILVPAPSGHSFCVQHGPLQHLNTHSFPIFQSLMSLMDAYRPFELSKSAMVGGEDDTTSTVLVGSVVVDVFISLFNNIVDFSELPFLQAKTLFQTLIIVIFKHDMESPPLRHLSEHLKRAVRRACDFLLVSVNYELRQLALSALQAYLKRWPLQARTILIHTLQTVIKVVSKIETQDEVVAAQASSFIEGILVDYASSNLFYHLCKRPLDSESFTAIKHILAKNARTNQKNSSLKDVILMDTLTQIASQPIDTSQKKVIENLQTYINVIHHQDYTSETLQLVGRCLYTIVKTASETPSEVFDVNPILGIATTLIQHNKTQTRDFLPFLEQILRLALVRFDVNKENLIRLMQVTSTLYRKSNEHGMLSDRLAQVNVCISVVVEVLSDALHTKYKINPATFFAMAKAISIRSNQNDGLLLYITNGMMQQLAVDSFLFLQNGFPGETASGFEMLDCKSAASIVLTMTEIDVGFLTRYFSDQVFDRNGRQMITVRTWNILLLEVLENELDSKIANQFLACISFFSPSYHGSLRTPLNYFSIPVELTTSDVNHAYIALKLWMLLAQKCSLGMKDQHLLDDTKQTFETRNEHLVWNELWPSFDKLVMISEVDAENGEVPPLASLIWSSVADIFLFLRHMRSIVSVESSSHIATLNRLKGLAVGETFTMKFMRAVHSMTEISPELVMSTLLVQIRQELLAAEKLRILEMRREASVGRSL